MSSLQDKILPVEISILPPTKAKSMAEGIDLGWGNFFKPLEPTYAIFKNAKPFHFIDENLKFDHIFPECRIFGEKTNQIFSNGIGEVIGPHLRKGLGFGFVKAAENFVSAVAHTGIQRE